MKGKGGKRRIKGGEERTRMEEDNTTKIIVWLQPCRESFCERNILQILFHRILLLVCVCVLRESQVSQVNSKAPYQSIYI